MAEPDFDEQVHRPLVGAWHQYLVTLEPLRPDLFRYCRRLTGNVWDAEDLVQDTLLRAFAKLSQVLYSIQNRRAYLLRIATNLWLDELRTRAVERADLATRRAESGTRSAPASPAADRAELRDAGAILLERLAPQERAAWLLTEAFGMSIEEAAGILGTTAGATKSALHRGRESLKDLESPPRVSRPRAPSALLDRFVERYNARDLPGLLALMRDDGAIEMHGSHSELGREGFERKRGWFYHNFHNPFDGKPSTARWRVAELEGEPVVLVLNPIGGAETLTSVMRIDDLHGRVRRIQVYAFCPDVIREVGERLGLPTHTWGYHFPIDFSARPLER